MAISIDTVYQRVLAAANKEQRGYITPLEFNLMANQAQLSIFEQYFYDRHQLARGEEGNDTGYGDTNHILDQKIARWESSVTAINGVTLPTNMHLLNSVSLKFGAEKLYPAQRINLNDWDYIRRSPLLQPTKERPVYVQLGNAVNVYGPKHPTQGYTHVVGTPPYSVVCRIVSRPGKVEWGYNVVAEKALYNAGTSTDFDIHESEETTLVLKILELAGVILNKPGLVQIADQEDIKRIQQQKM